MGFFNFLGSIVNPVFGALKTSAEERKLKIEGKLSIQKAKIDYKVAKLESKSKAQGVKAENSISYDMQVLRNRSKTFMDELIIIAFMLLIIMHFIPGMQGYMRGGWEAMGYGEKPPLWFEFAIIGILVSTLGLKGLFQEFIRMFTSRFGMKAKA